MHMYPVLPNADTCNLLTSKSFLLPKEFLPLQQKTTYLFEFNIVIHFTGALPGFTQGYHVLKRIAEVFQQSNRSKLEELSG